MVPEENYFAKMCLTSKGQGQEARRSAHRSNRIVGGRTLKKRGGGCQEVEV